MIALTAKTALKSVFWPVVLLLAIIIVATVAVMYFRNKLLRDSDQGSGPGLTLSDIRRMRDRGEMTEQEYLRARQLIIGEVASVLAAETPPKEPTGPTGQAGVDAPEDGAEDDAPRDSL